MGRIAHLSYPRCKRLYGDTSMSTLPVYVIGGFLGSGKTTLLKRILAYSLDHGLKPAVLMNEYGEMDVAWIFHKP